MDPELRLRAKKVVTGIFLDISSCHALQNLPLDPAQVDNAAIDAFLEFRENLEICPGNEDDHFVRLVKSLKGQMKSKSGEVLQYQLVHPLLDNAAGTVR